VRRRPSSAVRRLMLAALTLLVAGCADTLRNDGPQVSLPEPPKQAEPSPGTQREHQRILAA
jgi:hypothetical protein